MDFKDYIKELSNRVAKLKDQIATEEATKNAFIMPFIQMLGYDVFNPLEVVPELDCDLIKKKGEKSNNDKLYLLILSDIKILLREIRNGTP